MAARFAPVCCSAFAAGNRLCSLARVIRSADVYQASRIRCPGEVFFGYTYRMPHASGRDEVQG